ncbi:MAG TPA: tetratricopeptide repeat protein [Candidatus Cryosericum sp.]|nr:tetratricopeptide repeat protein [Candidatus Cryosericum sp.]
MPRRSRHLAGTAAALAAVLASAAPAFAQGYGGTVEDILVRAESLLAQERVNESIVQFQEVRTLCPTPGEIVSSMQGEARAHIVIKEFLPAAGLLEEAAQRFPDDPRIADVLYMAGFARRQGGDLKGAIPLFEKALEHNPTPDVLPAIKYQLANTLRLTGQAGKAGPLVADFETEFPQHQLIPNALYTAAIAFHDSRELEKSETTYRHLIETYPRTQAALESLYELGVVLSERGKRSEAAEFFRRYSNGSPSSPVAARAMERAADMTFFHSPSEAALYYGVAQVKAQSNPMPTVPDLAVSRWLGAKLAIARALSQTWVLALLAGVLIVAAGAAAWFGLRRWRRRGAGQPGQAIIT